MKLFNNAPKKKSIIEKTAAYYDRTPEEVQKEIKEIIEVAWESDDPQVKAFQQQHFPTGKPTPEEFIEGIAKIINQHHSSPAK